MMSLEPQDGRVTVPVIPRETLRDLYARFILNLPDKIREECSQNFVRLFFEVERAHWFYLDYYIDDPSVGGVDMYGFTLQLFDAFPELIKNINWEEKFVEWRRYRRATETGSAIIIDEYNKMVLLVQGFYNNRWIFPGGKVNEYESLVQCAVREVLEETGLDIEHRISPTLYIDRYVGGTLRRAFIVENMPRTSRLQPGTKNEIEVITWFNIDDIPSHMQDNISVEKLNTSKNSFFLVMPFIKQLKCYVTLRQYGLPSVDALRESQRLADIQTSIAPPPKVESTARIYRKQAQHHAASPHYQRRSSSANKNKQNPTETKNLTGNFTFIVVNNSDNFTAAVNGEHIRPVSCWRDVRLQKEALLDALCPK